MDQQNQGYLTKLTSGEWLGSIHLTDTYRLRRRGYQDSGRCGMEKTLSLRVRRRLLPAALARTLNDRRSNQSQEGAVRRASRPSSHRLGQSKLHGNSGKRTNLAIERTTPVKSVLITCGCRQAICGTVPGEGLRIALGKLSEGRIGVAAVVGFGLVEVEGDDALLQRLLAAFVTNVATDDIAPAHDAVEGVIESKADELIDAGYPAALVDPDKPSLCDGEQRRGRSRMGNELAPDAQ